MKKLSLPALAIALALAGASTTASAASFLVLQAGRSDVDIDVSGAGSASDKDTSYAVRGGYYFNPNFGVEAFYTNVYDESQDGASVKANALGAGVVAKKNFGADGNGFFINGRAGVSRGKLEASVDGLGRDTSSSYDPYVGIGAGYDFSRSFGLSLNFDHLRGKGDGVDVTANVLMLGIEFRTE